MKTYVEYICNKQKYINDIQLFRFCLFTSEYRQKHNFIKNYYIINL